MSGEYSRGQVPNVLVFSWAANTTSAAVQNMGVDHRGANVLMPKQLLHGANVVAVSQQVCRKRMAKCVAGHSFGQPSFPHGGLDRLLNERFVNMMTPLLAGPLVHPPIVLGENELPAPLLVGVWILASQPCKRVTRRIEPNRTRSKKALRP